MNKLSFRNFSTSQKRREFLEKKLNTNLSNISSFSFTEEVVLGRNIENLIGATQIPLGVAGPLKIKSVIASPSLRSRVNSAEQSTQDGDPTQIASSMTPRNDKKSNNYFLPLATTEGALVASISRGCKAITLAGGANVVVEEVGQTRGPVFKTKDITHSNQVKNWIEKNFKNLAKATEKTSSHLKLNSVLVNYSANLLFARFSYNTSSAMGMNMVTIATEAAVILIEKETLAKCISLAGNYDIDKKPAWLNFIEGRGKRVWADIVISKKIVKDVLKTTPEKIVEVVKAKTHIGSIMSGSLGFNCHFANIIASLFVATGQDLAHVVEGSLGITDAEIKDGNLYFSIFMPSLEIGVIGGGTNLPTQLDAFKILNLSEKNKVVEFASVTAGTVLAGELSLLASLSENSLASAHKRLGRRKSV